MPVNSTASSPGLLEGTEFRSRKHGYRTLTWVALILVRYFVKKFPNFDVSSIGRHLYRSGNTSANVSSIDACQETV